MFRKVILYNIRYIVFKNIVLTKIKFLLKMRLNVTQKKSLFPYIPKKESELIFITSIKFEKMFYLK